MSETPHPTDLSDDELHAAINALARRKVEMIRDIAAGISLTRYGGLADLQRDLDVLFRIVEDRTRMAQMAADAAAMRRDAELSRVCIRIMTSAEGGDTT